MKNKKPKEEFKEIENSELSVKIVERIVQDEFGRKTRITKWVSVDKPLNLGSYKNPDSDILEIKFKVPNKEKWFKN